MQIIMRDNDFTNGRLRALCEPLNVERELTSEEFEEIENKLCDMEYERDEFKISFENEQQRADELSDEVDTSNETIATLEDRISELEEQIEKLKNWGL